MAGLPSFQLDPIRDRAGVDRFLEHLTRFGVKLGLDTIRRLLSALGNPHETYPVVHIAGTNGKGSTCAMIDTLLASAGLTVGRYTSPHLIDFSERITVAGHPVGDAALVRHADALRAVISGADGAPTFFEAATAIAFRHFADPDGRGVPVDAAVVEVGMGGRFDATNQVMPKVCVITNVGLEHTEYLGDTVAAVAFEKAGIIKPGIPVVTGADGDALKVIAGRAEEVGAPLYVLGRDFDICGAERGGEPFSYRGIRTNYGDLSCGLLGAHQRRNAALALAAVELFFPKGVAADAHRVKAALAGVRHPGRLEQVDGTPPVWLDCAHNSAGARALSDSLRELGDEPLWLVLGVLADKDFSAILVSLAPLAQALVLTAPRHPRRGDLAAQAEAAARHACSVTVEPDVARAVDLAMEEAGAANGRVVVAGSVFTVGEARGHLLGNRR
ncbi:MAG: bifunctional folylpolyglutamate synthase/dihydrofolate synthase [Leptospirillia bacterium]